MEDRLGRLPGQGKAVRDNAVGGGGSDERVGVVERGQEGWLALGKRQFAFGAGVDHEADVGADVVFDAIGLKD